jgi:hypothetical protein
VTKNNLIDGAVGTGGMSIPLWMNVLNTGLQEVLLIGGAILIVVRVMLAVREWHDRSHK